MKKLIRIVLLAWLINFLRCILHGPRRRLGFNFTVGPFGTKTERRPEMPETIKLTNKQKVEVTLRPVIREEGKEDTPVNLDGAPTWSIQSGNCTVEPSEDGLKAWVISGDEPGTSEILVEGDADLGEGVVTISDTLSVEVTNPLANNLGLSVGTPVDK